MTDNNPTRKVEVASFEPPKSNTNTVKPKNKALPYILSLGAILILVPLLFKLFDLLGSTSNPDVLISDIIEEQPIEEAEAPLEELPFEDALLAEARLEAQDILAELLPLRASLESRGAEAWAQEQLLTIFAFGESGDLLYQERQFEPAILEYEKALDAAKNLDGQSAEVASNLRSEANDALAQNDAQSAIEIFELALLIEPDNQDAQSGLTRSLSLDQVIVTTELSESLLLDGQLEEAKIKVEEALNLDSDYLPANELLSRVDEAILIDAFQKRMSEGYSSLAQGNYGVAETAFRNAQSLMPNNSAASDALVQLEASREADRGANLLQQATIATSNENWLEAKQAYDQLLLENPNRVEAKVSLVQVEARLALHNNIESVFADPLSLKDQTAWREAENLLIQARSLQDGGPILQAQVEELALVIRKARTPVRVEITSDGLTDVSILGLSQFGLVRNHPLDLNPGKYIILGKKSGFQDIREEVLITGDEPLVRIHIEPTQSLGSL